MASNYKRLGNYIQQIDVRNTDLSVDLLLGVSIEKKFIDSHANTIGTDFSKYKIVKRGQFAYAPVTSRNGDKISIALLEEADACLISSSYTPFEIIKPKELNAEYLMMLFRNPEFDRYARYNSWGSAREVFSWNDLCDTELNLPDIRIQNEIVHQFRTIKKRIEVLEKITNNLTEFIVNYNDSFVKKFSKGNNFGELEQLCEKIYSGGTPSTSEKEYWDGEFSWLTSGETSNSYITFTSKTITEKGVKKSSTKFASKGATVIASAGQGKTRGQTSYLLKDMYVNQSVIVLQPKKNCGAYVFSNLKGRYDELRNGSDLNSIRGSLTTTEIKKLPIFIPTNEEMQLFHEKIQPILDYIEINTKEIDILTLLKKKFLENLF